MKQPDEIDVFLRTCLINWALEDIQHPIKRNTLTCMSQDNWMHYLYSQEKEDAKEPEKTLRLYPHEKKNLYRDNAFKQEAFVEPAWAQELLKAIYFALKKAYRGKFEVSKWKMRRINTTGMYVLGPVNSFGEVFFKFKVGIKNNIVFWDLENHRGKIRPKGFEGVPRVILSAVEKSNHDFMIRKISKGFGMMLYSGKKSKKLLQLLLDLKGENIGIGNDPHGNMWIQEGKKKLFRLETDIDEQDVHWLISNKENSELLDWFSSQEEMLQCIKALNVPKTYRHKRQC